MLGWNVNGLGNKLFASKELQQTVLQHDVVILTETKIKPTAQPKLAACLAAAFDVHILSRPVGAGAGGRSNGFGGVLALVRKSLTASIQLSIADAANGIMWFKLSGSAADGHTQASILHIGACYLPPEGSKVYDRPLVQDPWPLLQHHLLTAPGTAVRLGATTG